MSETVVKKNQIPSSLEEIQFPSGEILSDDRCWEGDLDRQQSEILIRLLEWFWRDRTDFYASGNLTIYFSNKQTKSPEFRGADFFVVLGCEKKPRNSWVVWKENGLYPHVIIELLSETTANTDRGLKKQIYQNIFRTFDYFLFDPATLKLQGFNLLEGKYQPIESTPEGWLWSEELKLYLGVDAQKVLRFFTESGELVLLPEEELAQQVEKEKQRAEEAMAEVERLKAILKEVKSQKF